jgi:hypothetical protein
MGISIRGYNKDMNELKNMIFLPKASFSAVKQSTLSAMSLLLDGQRSTYRTQNVTL